MSPLPLSRKLFPSFVTLSLSCLTLLSAAPAAAQTDVDLDGIDALARGGAPTLALRMLEHGQPAPTETDEWIVWEKRRIAIYRSLRDFDAIVRRAEQLPGSVPEDFRRWMLMEAAKALLSAHDGARARRFLRRLIWHGQAADPEIARWRRLIIRSYLGDNNLGDAQTALLRYQHDYRATSDIWQQLQAEILLRQHRYRIAFETLAGNQTYEGRLMRLAAGLRSGILAPADAGSAASKLAGQLGAYPELRRKAWAVAAEAADRADDKAARARLLEEALTVPDSKDDAIFPVHADDLWLAYDQLAEALGNRSRLLVGEDEQWLEKARTYKKGKAYYGRALYAFLGNHGWSEATRTIAHDRLAGELLAEGRGHVLQALYTHSARFPDVDNIPAVVRARLADRALGMFEVKLAARLIKGLEQPPGEQDIDAWNLKRARILIYAGDYRPAAVILSGMLDGREKMVPDLAEAYMQVVFDLQTVGQHGQAIVLLESLYKEIDDDRMRREILYWEADSKAALGRQEEAAELYLRSATYNGSNGSDPWGQTARFHGAEALGKAGLIDDARNVYLKLLKTTADPKRRAVIERNLQQLWLAERSATTP